MHISYHLDSIRAIVLLNSRRRSTNFLVGVNRTFLHIEATSVSVEHIISPKRIKYSDINTDNKDKRRYKISRSDFTYLIPLNIKILKRYLNVKICLEERSST